MSLAGVSPKSQKQDTAKDAAVVVKEPAEPVVQLLKVAEQTQCIEGQAWKVQQASAC